MAQKEKRESENMPHENGTKEKIYAAALRLFAENGFGETSVRQIAAEAKVNQASIYWAYKNKKEILDEIVSSFLRVMKRYILTKEKADKLIELDSSREILERVFPHFQEGEVEYMYMSYKIVCTEQFNNQKANDIVTGEFRGKIKAGIQYMLELMKERGKVKEMNVEFVAEMWTQSLYCDFILWAHTIDKYGIEGIRGFKPTNRRVIDFVLQGNT